ncbi:MAG: radical SAM protein [Desulfomonilia bacterium]
MELPEFNHDAIQLANKRDYDTLHDVPPWVGPILARAYAEQRDTLLREISGKAHFAFHASKPYSTALSPGCRLCGEGLWSCLFINNICNASCFFCPTEQKTIDKPGTNTLTFSNPRDYIDYLEYFGFRGVSISGGEPFLSFDLSMTFLSRIKKRFGENLYVWLYTNGALADEDTLRMLRDAGLDEIRFNIHAAGYDLEKIGMAVGIIPRVTVEIPAVPEETRILTEKAHEMNEMGVDFLNLHQIRCTPFNSAKLSARGYTLTHGPKVGVPESEICALTLLAHALRADYRLGVNYCSLIYRHRFQTRSARRRWAEHIKKPFEDITPAGVIRTLSLKGPHADIMNVKQRLVSRDISSELWEAPPRGDRIFLSSALLPKLDTRALALAISYSISSLHPSVTYRNAYREIQLNPSRSVVIERRPVFPDMELTDSEHDFYIQRVLLPENDLFDIDTLYTQVQQFCTDQESIQKWQLILHCERLRSGLLEYF